MTWEFFDIDGGTKIRFSYAVGGYSPQGLDSIAADVDAVLGEAIRTTRRRRPLPRWRRARSARSTRSRSPRSRPRP
jgi:hypothetical protein